jgi:hypothetical protein
MPGDEFERLVRITTGSQQLGGPLNGKRDAVTVILAYAESLLEARDIPADQPWMLVSANAFLSA